MTFSVVATNILLAFAAIGGVFIVAVALEGVRWWMRTPPPPRIPGPPVNISAWYPVFDKHAKDVSEGIKKTLDRPVVHAIPDMVAEHEKRLRELDKLVTGLVVDTARHENRLAALDEQTP